MDLMQSEDQDAIESTVRAFLDERIPLARVRTLVEGDTSEALGDLWRQAGELGFFGLGLPEAEGGAGFSLAEEMVLLRELGRLLTPGPWLGSILAAHLLDDQAQRDAILLGNVACALASVRDGDRFELANGVATAELSQVADAEFATALLVDDGDGWFYLAPGFAFESAPLRSLDPTRGLSSVSFDGVPCAPLASGGAATRAREMATVLSCAEAVGGIERTVEMSIEYCKVRTQFGQPIGSFQAVKHRCADMAVRAEVARSATIYATIAVRDGAEDAGHHVSVAKLLCADAYLANGADNIQNHGGMGFTWECDAHLYMKRAHGFDVAWGSRIAQLDALVAEMRG